MVASPHEPTAMLETAITPKEMGMAEVWTFQPWRPDPGNARDIRAGPFQQLQTYRSYRMKEVPMPTETGWSDSAAIRKAWLVGCGVQQDSSIDYLSAWVLVDGRPQKAALTLQRLSLCLIR